MAIAGLSVPSELLKVSEAALSDRLVDEYDEELFNIAPNPFPEGRQRQAAVWREDREWRARRLIWC